MTQIEMLRAMAHVETAIARLVQSHGRVGGQFMPRPRQAKLFKMALAKARRRRLKVWSSFR